MIDGALCVFEDVCGGGLGLENEVVYEGRGAEHAGGDRFFEELDVEGLVEDEF